MIIDSIEIYYVKHPLISPWRTAYGEDADVYSVMVRMDSGSYNGWSESMPLYAPTYSPEFAAGVYCLVKEIFAPMLVGKEISSASVWISPSPIETTDDVFGKSLFHPKRLRERILISITSLDSLR